MQLLLVIVAVLAVVYLLFGCMNANLADRLFLRDLLDARSGEFRLWNTKHDRALQLERIRIIFWWGPDLAVEVARSFLRRRRGDRADQDGYPYPGSR